MSKVFIDKVSSNIGQAILEELRNDHLPEQEPHQFFTLQPSEAPPSILCPLPVISNQAKDPKRSLEAILDCDIMIFDVHFSDLEELEYYLKGIRDHSFSSERSLVFISDVLVWGDTPPKLQETTEEEAEQIEATRLPEPVEETTLNQEESNPPETGQPVESIEATLIDEVPVDETLQTPTHFKIVPYEECDFLMRKALPKYEGWKSLENIVLRLSKKEKLNAYILCAGVLYGCGEIALESHFTNAWTDAEEGVPFLTPGNNLVPMIHLLDLAKLVRRTIELQPVCPYIFAIDHSGPTTQRSIAQTISTHIGNGVLSEIPFTEGVMLEWSEYLTLNLWFTPSSLFAEDTEWHAKDGLTANIETVNQEFNLYRGLTPIKVFLIGPPAAGKSYFASKLAEIFNLPYLHVAAVTEELLSGDHPIALKIQEGIQTLKQQMIEEAESKKKKNQELDYSKFNPRIPDELLAEGYRWKLGQTRCRNRGYVLDGWPRKFEDAKSLFSEDEVVYTDLLPTTVIVLKATNEALTQRVKTLPDAYTQGTHFTDDGMKRRLAVYREHTEKLGPPVWEFFTQQGIEPVELEAIGDALELFNTIKETIERNGPINNFREFGEVKLVKNESYQKLLESARQNNEEAEDQEEEKEAEPARNNMEELLMLEQLRSKEKDMLELKSQPYRHYLFEKVVPTLFEGLVKLTKELPDDPIEALAAFLEDKSKQSSS